MPARVFVALLVTDSGRLTAAELADLLQISPAAVSGAVRYLGGLGLVHKERVPVHGGSTTGCPATSGTRSCCMRNQVLIRWAALLKEGMDLVGADTPAGRRMAGHAGFFEFLARGDARRAWPAGTPSAKLTSPDGGTPGKKLTNPGGGAPGNRPNS